jgi:uroporphyrinogen-III synthase
VTDAPATGLTVGITADRRSDDQAILLERLGFEVVRGPTLGTLIGPDDDTLRRVTAQLIDRPPDYLLADTGIGIRSWLEAASSWGLEQDLLEALGRARIAVRGPKAAGAVRSAGLETWWKAPSEQLAAVVDRLLEERLEGSRIAVQLHGEDDPRTVATLTAAGATVVSVPIYRWTVPDDSQPALRLIELAIEGGLDAVTFTSAPAVHGLVALARGAGVDDELVAALNGDILVACVGPVCSAAARQEGIDSPVHPQHWRLGSLVRLVEEELSRRHQEVSGR